MTGEAGESARGAPEQYGLCYVDLSRTDFAPGAASLLPEETARRERAVPIERRGQVTVVAVSSPADELTMESLRTVTGGEVMTVVAPAGQVMAAISRLYGGVSAGRGSRRGDADEENPSTAPSTLEESLRDVLAAPDPEGYLAPVVPLQTGGELHPPSEDEAAPALADVPPPPTEPGTRKSSAAAEKTSNGTRQPPAVTVATPELEAPDRGAGETASVTPTPAEPDHGSDTSAQAPAASIAIVAPPPPEVGGVPSNTERVARDRAGSVAGSSSPGDVSTLPGASPPLPPPGKGSPGGEAGDAISAQWPALARVLVASGRVSLDNMSRALRDHRSLGESLARYLQREQLVTEEDLVRAMAEEMGLEFVDLSAMPIDPAIASLVPAAVSRRHMVLPIRVEDGTPLIAMANPTDVFAIDDLRTIMGRPFKPVVSLRSQIEVQLRRLVESETDVQEVAQSAAGAMSSQGTGYELENIQSVVEDAPIVRYVNLLILQALNERASDIHIEPTPRRVRIRFRIDGVMHDATSASPAIHPAVISRLKVLGEMDITEHRVPQEGRVSVSVGDRQIDLRLAVIPSLYGETCVMRLLDKTASIRTLPELGLLPETLERYSRSYSQPYGVILVTGPTGAGKTTTLYATLQEVMSNEKSVVTVEDPVEYQIEGITQVQINPKAGLLFSTALRSILRADPDIILVGEIRDIETATIAMEAALSGHLVLTTLHTNTAASTPLRLTEMGIEPFLVTSAVTGVLTQRLARVLCPKCKTPFEATVADFHAAGYKDSDFDDLDSSTLWRANGCRSCSHTGYHGRMILSEVMPMTEEIERMIIEQQSIVAMERQAVEQGMRTLRQDGLYKALTGYTTLEEVLRVVV